MLVVFKNFILMHARPLKYAEAALVLVDPTLCLPHSPFFPILLIFIIYCVHV